MNLIRVMPAKGREPMLDKTQSQHIHAHHISMPDVDPVIVPEAAAPKPPTLDAHAAMPPRADDPEAMPQRRFGFLRDLAFVGVSLIGLWWLAVLVFRPPAFMLPGPDRVAAMLWLRLPDLAAATAVTATEMILGLLAGTALGIATALVMAVSAPARKLMMPLVVVAQSLPVFAVAPVLVLWFGFGLTSKVVMATIIIFFPVASAFHDGLSRTDPGLLDLASLYRASPLQRLAYIRLPAAMPSLVSGLRMAAAVAPIGAVIGEWVGASNGLGLVMIHANARLQTDLMFAALVIVAGLAVGLRLAVDRATRRLVPWLPEHD